MLNHHICQRISVLQERAMNQPLADRPGAILPHWPLVRRLMATKRLNRRAKALLLSTIYGTSPDPAWLTSHGWKIDGKCRHCNSPLTGEHMASGCQPPKLPSLLAARSIPPRLDRTDEIPIHH
jgi:hypothetical protein